MLVKNDDVFAMDENDESGHTIGSGLGGHIIRTVKSYVTLMSQDHGMTSPLEAIDALDQDTEQDHHPAVMHALKQVVGRRTDAAARYAVGV